jgi:hypothetical protein
MGEFGNNIGVYKYIQNDAISSPRLLETASLMLYGVVDAVKLAKVAGALFTPFLPESKDGVRTCRIPTIDLKKCPRLSILIMVFEIFPFVYQIGHNQAPP